MAQFPQSLATMGGSKLRLSTKGHQNVAQILCVTDRVDSAAGEETPKGCLLASATASGSAASADVQAAVAAIREFIVDCLRARVERDIRSGELLTQTNAASLAAFVMTTMQGLSVTARDGMSRASLLSIVDIILEAWPKAPEAQSA